ALAARRRARRRPPRQDGPGGLGRRLAGQVQRRRTRQPRRQLDGGLGHLGRQDRGAPCLASALRLLLRSVRIALRHASTHTRHTASIPARAPAALGNYIRDGPRTPPYRRRAPASPAPRPTAARPRDRPPARPRATPRARRRPGRAGPAAGRAGGAARSGAATSRGGESPATARARPPA